MSRRQRSTRRQQERRAAGTQEPRRAAKHTANPAWYQNRLLLSIGLSIALIAMAAGILVGTGAWDPLVSLIAGTPRSPSGIPVARTISATGRLVIVGRGALSLLTLPDRKERELVSAQSRSVVTSARWRPDGRAAAYSYVNWPTGEAAPKSDIYLTEEGGEPRRLIEAGLGELLESPAWSPDGAALYVSSTVTENRVPVQRLQRSDVASGTRASLGEGLTPDVSPDGGLIAAVRMIDINPTLVLLRPDGSLVRTLVNPGRFTLIGPPRFSPDGQQLAVTLAAAPRQAGGVAPTSPFGLLSLRTAYAHGNPSELYLIDVAGGEPRRLTSIAEDEPAVSWSPDGSLMAIYSTQGLYLVDGTGKTTLATNNGGYGTIDWAP